MPGAELPNAVQLLTPGFYIRNLTAQGLVVAAQVPSLHSHRRQLSPNEVSCTMTGILALLTSHPQTGLAAAGTTVVPAVATELWQRSRYLTPEEAAEQFESTQDP